MRRLEPHQPLWCEEPVTPVSLNLLAEVKRLARDPIGAGERLYTLPDFYRLTALRAADIIQMDVAHCGGILAAPEICPATRGRRRCSYCPHCFSRRWRPW